MSDINGLVVVIKTKQGRYFTGGIKAGKFVRYREVKKLADLKFRDEYVTLAAYLKSINSKGRAELILNTLKIDRMYVRMITKAKTTVEKIAPKSKVAKKIVDKPEAKNSRRFVDFDVPPATEAAWEKWWWMEFHPYCLKCLKSCKQSAKLAGIYCPTRVTKEEPTSTPLSVLLENGGATVNRKVKNPIQINKKKRGKK